MSPDVIQLPELIDQLEYALLDPLPGYFYRYFIKYYFVVNVPCTADKSITVPSQFEMFFHHVTNIYSVKRDKTESQIVTMWGNQSQSKLSFGQFTANIVIENNWRATNLPKLINFIYPSHYCKGLQSNPYSNRGDSDHMHVFMVDKFLLCPQITLNQTEYRILSESSKLQLLHSSRQNAYIDYTLGLDGEIKVCLAEYDRIMTSSNDKHASSNCLFLALTVVVIFQNNKIIS